MKKTLALNLETSCAESFGIQSSDTNDSGG